MRTWEMHLRAIPEPAPGTRAVLAKGGDWTGGQALVTVTGNPRPVRMLCGACGALLAEGVSPGQVRDMVLRCDCGAYNETLN